MKQMTMEFYSARLLFVILVNDGRPKKRNHFDESVVVFCAKNFTAAFKRALRLGKKQESKYRNQNGQQVRWALVDILKLDWIGKKIEGMEVASKLHYRNQLKPIPVSKVFHPERSKPEGSF